jgi:hypothetical protein
MSYRSSSKVMHYRSGYALKAKSLTVLLFLLVGLLVIGSTAAFAQTAPGLLNDGLVSLPKSAETSFPNWSERLTATMR